VVVSLQLAFRFRQIADRVVVQGDAWEMEPDRTIVQFRLEGSGHENVVVGCELHTSRTVIRHSLLILPTIVVQPARRPSTKDLQRSADMQHWRKEYDRKRTKMEQDKIAADLEKKCVQSLTLNRFAY